MRDAVRHLRPRYVVLENVAGHRSLGFDTVLGDLAEERYDTQWCSLRASDVGAPHHRERLFILATPADADRVGLETQRLASRPAPPLPGDHNSHDPLAGADRAADVEHELHLRWGINADAIARWASIHGEPPPIIVDHIAGYAHEDILGHRFPDIRPGINPGFVEWMMGLPAGWVTETPGLTRTQQLRCIGNGVCPQQGAAAIRHLLERTSHDQH